jgi:hypothetical protein
MGVSEGLIEPNVNLPVWSTPRCPLSFAAILRNGKVEASLRTPT